MENSFLVGLVREYQNLPQGQSALYRRVELAIKRYITNGKMKEADALPPERDLAQALTVSRVTIRKAVQQLVIQGLLVQRQGAGTFIAGRVEQPLSRLTGFTEDMSERGLQPDIVWLDRSVGWATPQEAEALSLPPQSHVARLYRIRLAGDKPMCLELATLPQIFLPDPSVVTNSLYHYLESQDLRPVRAVQKIRAELLEIERARLLDVVTGSACLYIERQSFLPDGRAIEFVRSHYRGDAYDFVAELKL